MTSLVLFNVSTNQMWANIYTKVSGECLLFALTNNIPAFTFDLTAVEFTSRPNESRLSGISQAETTTTMKTRAPGATCGPAVFTRTSIWGAPTSCQVVLFPLQYPLAAALQFWGPNFEVRGFLGQKIHLEQSCRKQQGWTWQRSFIKPSGILGNKGW